MSGIFTPFSAEIDKMALIKWEEEYAKEIGIRQINELLSGKKLSMEEYKEMAETNIKETLKASAFSLKEKQDFYKKKWLKEPHCHNGIFRYLYYWSIGSRNSMQEFTGKLCSHVTVSIGTLPEK